MIIEKTFLFSIYIYYRIYSFLNPPKRRESMAAYRLAITQIVYDRSNHLLEYEDGSKLTAFRDLAGTMEQYLQILLVT